MNLRFIKLLLCSALLFLSISSFALPVVEWGTPVRVQPQKNCFDVDYVIWDEGLDAHDKPYKILISTGKVRIGPDCNGMQAPVGISSDCDPVEINGDVFYTSAGSPNCLGDMMLNDADAYNMYLSVKGDILEATAGQRPAPSGVSSTSQVERFLAYPNPAKDVLFFDGWTNTKDGKARIAMYDMLGRVVYNSDIDVSMQSFRLAISIKDLPRGLYEVKFISGSDLKANQKIILN